MKTSIEFSYSKPIITALTIVLITFVLLHFEAFDNPNRPKVWIMHFITAYSLIAGISYLTFHFIFKKYKDPNNWTFGKDIVALLFILTFVLLYILIFNSIYINYIDENFIDSYVYDGRLYYYLIFIGNVNFGAIKFLDFYVFYKKKSKNNIQNIDNQKIVLVGKNKHEKIKLEIEDLVMIEALGNYVLVHYLNHEKQIEKDIIRNSFSLISDQIQSTDQMLKIHRSYIVNVSKIINLETRKRKVLVKIKFIDELIPVSKSVVESLKEVLLIN